MPGIRFVKAASSFLNDHIGAILLAGIMAIAGQTVYAYGELQVLKDRWETQLRLNDQFVRATHTLDRLESRMDERDRQEALRVK